MHGYILTTRFLTIMEGEVHTHDQGHLKAICILDRQFTLVRFMS